MNETQTHFFAGCPYCSAQLRIRRAFAGQHVQCKHCNETFVAKGSDDPAEGASGEVDAVRSLPPASAAERVVVTCPNCQAALSIRRIYLGRQVRCKQCDGTFLALDSPAPVITSREGPHDRNGDETQSAVLQAELDRQKQEAGRLREELARTTADLEAIRAHLGQIDPAAVRPLFEERASLLAEIDRLRDEVSAFNDERSARDREADQRERRRDEELNAALTEVDRLTGLVHQGSAELDAARNEQNRLDLDRRNAVDEAARLRGILVEREQALEEGGNRLRGEMEELRIERDRLRSDLEDLRRAFDDREQSHREELSRREEQLRQAGDLAREREALLAERARLLDEGRDLRRSLDEAEQGRRDDVGRLDADLATVSEESRQLRERLDAAERASAELRERNQALQAELDQHRLSMAMPISDGELRAAQAEIESLKRKLDLSDRLQREMAGILGGMGIRVRES